MRNKIGNVGQGIGNIDKSVNATTVCGWSVTRFFDPITAVNRRLTIAVITHMALMNDIKFVWNTGFTS